MTKNKRFTLHTSDERMWISDLVTHKEIDVDVNMDKIVDLLNIQSEYVDKCAKEKEKLVECVKHLQEENEQLKQEKEDWKSNCLSTINENSILWNEIAIMREQGAKPSSAFEEYCSKFKGDVND